MRRVLIISTAAAIALATLAAVAFADTMIGTDGAERLQGTPGPDQIGRAHV